MVFVVILRFSVASGYRTAVWAPVYGAAFAATHAVTGKPLGEVLLGGVVATVVSWIVLDGLKRLDGSLLWWPLLVVGILMPVAVYAVLGGLVG